MVDSSVVPNEWLDRLLSRLDHMDNLSTAVSNLERARRLEAQDTLLADAIALAPRAAPQAPVSHRGPGTLPAPVAPARQDEEPSPDNSRKAFSNLLVKARSATTSPTERFDIGSPERPGPTSGQVQNQDEARAAHIAIGLLPRLHGQSPAPTAAPALAPASGAFQSPEPCARSTGSPGFHAGVQTPPGLPHGSGAGRSHRLAPAALPTSPLPPVEEMNLATVQGLRDVMETLRNVAVQDQERLYAIEVEQDDVHERLLKVERDVSELKMSFADHQTNAPDVFDIKRLDEKFSTLNVARRQSIKFIEEEIDAIKIAIAGRGRRHHRQKGRRHRH